MHNWNVDVEKFRGDEQQFTRWRLEQLINFGVDGEKIAEAELRRHWDALTLDGAKRRFLGYLLWGEKYLTSGR